MGVKERRERERQELKQSILSAAREIAAQDGWQSLTIRRVAELIEYSPPTIYEHFESKEAILQELAMEGFRRQLERVRAAFASTDDAEERLVRVSLAQCNFAWDNPELYQVMHGLGGAPCGPSEGPQEIHATVSTVQDAVLSILPDAATNKREFYTAMDILRSTLHGLITLTLEGKLHGGRTHARHLAKRAVHDWLVARRAT